jgi:hypothetical protein
MVRAIGEKIRDPTIADVATPDFKTTNDKDRAVAEMSLMATMQQYFTYTFCLIRSAWRVASLAWY